MAEKKPRKKTTRKKKPLVASVLVVYQEPLSAESWWRAETAEGEIVAQSDEGYRNRMYAMKLARAAYPGLPVEWR